MLSDETNDIWSMRADGTHVRRLTSSPVMEFDPTWSPDGSRIAYRHWPHDGTSRILVMKADGSGQTAAINNDRADGWADYSPDGKSFVFESNRNGSFDVYTRGVSGGTSSRLTNKSSFDGYPVWSPDQTEIAFESDRPGNLDLYVMNAQGTGLVQLTNKSSVDESPDWQVAPASPA